MKVQHLTPRDYVRQPWKNGGGFTTELATFPSPRLRGEGESQNAPSPRLRGEGRDEGQFLWRLSIAEVATSGPFSDFSGYERTIMLLEGEGMELSFGEAPPRVIDHPLRPFVFDGGWKTSCRLLGGPVRDFNLMIDRARAKGTLSLIPNSNLAVNHAWTLVYCAAGTAMVEGRKMDAGDLLRVDSGEGSVLKISPSMPEPTLAAVRIARC